MPFAEFACNSQNALTFSTRKQFPQLPMDVWYVANGARKMGLVYCEVIGRVGAIPCGCPPALGEDKPSPLRNGASEVNARGNKFVEREFGLVNANHERGAFLNEQYGLPLHQPVCHQAFAAGGVGTFQTRNFRALSRREVGERKGLGVLRRVCLRARFCVPHSIIRHFERPRKISRRRFLTEFTPKDERFEMTLPTSLANFTASDCDASMF